MPPLMRVHSEDEGETTTRAHRIQDIFYPKDTTAGGGPGESTPTRRSDNGT